MRLPGIRGKSGTGLETFSSPKIIIQQQMNNEQGQPRQGTDKRGLQPREASSQPGHVAVYCYCRNRVVIRPARPIAGIDPDDPAGDGTRGSGKFAWLGARALIAAFGACILGLIFIPGCPSGSSLHRLHVISTPEALPHLEHKAIEGNDGAGKLTE